MGMSPSSVMVIAGSLGFSLNRGAAFRKTGGSFGDSILVGSSGRIRFRIDPPFPAIQTFSPPLKTIACSTFVVMFDSCD